MVNFLSVTNGVYTNTQLSIVIMACVFIGFIFGAITVGVFKANEESEF